VPLTILEPNERVATVRGDVVVAVPLYGAHRQFVECIRSLLAHTPDIVPIVISDDASPDERSREFIEKLDDSGVLAHTVYYQRSAENRGFVRTVNDVFAQTSPADVIVVNSDCVVTDGWFQSMTRAARQSTLVATVSVFTNSGTIVSLPHRNQPQATLPQTIDLDSAAGNVRAGSLRLYPRVPTAIGHCFCVMRRAIDLVGPFDLAFSPGYGEEVDFSQRCVLHGLVHVVADDAFVLHEGSASFSIDGDNPGQRAESPVKKLHDQMIDVRYPYYYDWISRFSTDTTSPFARAFGGAERALRSTTVSIDGRCLTPIVTGTQVHTLEVIAAVSREGRVRLRVVVPPDLGSYARHVLDGLHDVEVLDAHAVGETTPRSDVVHRPFQITSSEDLTFLACLGERIVVTHQDLIAYHNPGYFASFETWRRHRQLTRAALSLADRVVFFSHSAAEEAIAEELVDRGRTEVVYIGTDHSLDDQRGIVAEQPPGVRGLGGRPFLLCLGTDFTHKNRTFVLRLLKELRDRHDWDGALVFAGAHVPIGSSSSEEASFFALHPELAEIVVDVAAIDEAAKRWLFQNATLMVYPSVHEGFGLVPFEAADAGLACVFAAQTSVAELLPSRLALIEQWDPQETASRVAPYLASEELRAQHVADVRAAAAPLTWRQTAHRLIDVYEEAAADRVRESRKLVDEIACARLETGGVREELRRVRHDFGRLEADYLTLRGVFDETAEGLVGSNGVIPRDLRRPLLAIGMRRGLRTPFFGLIRLLYRAGYRLRHRGRGPAPDPG